MKIWLIVVVVILLLPFCLADTCEDTCLSLGYDYAECREINEDAICENSEEDIGFVSCSAIERCCCGFDVNVTSVEEEPVVEEEPEIEVTAEEPILIAEEANDSIIVVEPVVLINTVPSVSTSKITVAEGETAIFTLEVQNNYFTYLWKKIFRTTNHVYVYDAEGDGIYFNLIGDSGFENSTILLYTGSYSFGWVTSEGDAGVYSDMLYVWDDEHAENPVIISFTTFVNQIVGVEIVEEGEPEEVEPEEEEVINETAVIEEESCVSTSSTNYAKFLSFVLVILLIILIILHMFTSRKKEGFFD